MIPKAAVPALVVIVNGAPGSGKSTLATELACVLELPLLSKDAIKETLAENLGAADRESSRRLGAASGEVIWTLLRDCPRGAVVDSWLAPHTREIVRAGLLRASVVHHVEIWCTAPAAVIRERFEARMPRRHPGHFDEDFLAELEDVAAAAKPLGLGPVIDVRTDQSVDVAGLLPILIAKARAE